MTYAFYTYYSGSYTDISKYYLKGGPVPFISRNRDYSVRAEDWQFVIAGTLRAVRGSTYNFTAGDKVELEGDSTVLFTGYVKQSNYDEDSDTFTIICRHALDKLNDYRIDHTTLNTLLTTGAVGTWLGIPDSYDYDGGGYYGSVVGWLWAIRCFFYKAGLELDVTEIDGVTLFTQPEINSQFFLGDVDIKYEHFHTFSDFFYSLNQETVELYTVIDDPEKDFNTNKPVLLDVFSEFCSSLYLTIVPTAVEKFKLYKSTSNYSHTTSEKWKSSSIPYLKKETADALGVSYTENTIDRTQEVIKSKGSGDKIKIMPNFEMLYSDAPNNTNKYQEEYSFTRLVISLDDDFGSCYEENRLVAYDDSGIETFEYDGYAPNMISAKYKALANDYTEEKYTINATKTIATVRENFIDPVEDNSEIIQES